MATEIRFTVYGGTLVDLMDQAAAQLLTLFRDWHLPGLSVDYDLDVSADRQTDGGKTVIWRGDVHAQLPHELSAVGLGARTSG